MMPKKTTKKPLKKKKLPFWQRWPAWRILGVFFGGGLVLAIGIWTTVYYAGEYIKNQEDKAKFAKIEKLVNDVTADLKKTYPNKDWQVVKYCQASRGELGDIIAISCTYGVKGLPSTSVEELSPVVGRHAESLGRRVDSWGASSVTYEAFNASLGSVSCVLYPSAVFGLYLKSNFSCETTANSFIYPEISR